MTMTYEEKYNKLAEDVVARDYHLILAMTSTTGILNPSYEPAKPNCIVECVKELVHTSLDLEGQFDKMDSEYQTWKSSMEILSEWNSELEQNNEILEQENKELKYRLEELEQ